MKRPGCLVKQLNPSDSTASVQSRSHLGAATHWETANPIVVIAVDHQPEATFHIQRHAAEEVLGQFTALIVEIVLGPIGT